MQTKLTFILMALWLFCATGFAQDVSNQLKSVSAAGGNATGAGGSASYTVGQVFYTSAFGSEGSVNMGVQQSFDISVETSIENTEDILLSCSLYPNPTTDFVVLSINNEKWLESTYQLYDLGGKLLDSQKITGSETMITLSNYLSSTYLLIIRNGNTLLKTFKIVKN